METEKFESLFKIAKKMFKINISRKISRIIKVSICAVRKNIPKVKSKYLIFKTSIAKVKIYLLVDNKNEVELINKFFMHANKIPFFKLEKSINFTIRNSKIV